jgi:hypothetical protein
MYRQIFSDEVPYSGISDFGIQSRVLRGTRPPRRAEITLGRGLSDDVWERLVAWWHQDASARPELVQAHDPGQVRVETILDGPLRVRAGV